MILIRPYLEVEVELSLLLYLRSPPRPPRGREAGAPRSEYCVMIGRCPHTHPGYGPAHQWIDGFLHSYKHNCCISILLHLNFLVYTLQLHIIKLYKIEKLKIVLYNRDVFFDIKHVK